MLLYHVTQVCSYAMQTVHHWLCNIQSQTHCELANSEQLQTDMPEEDPQRYAAKKLGLQAMYRVPQDMIELAIDTDLICCSFHQRVPFRGPKSAA